jgi:hypothetical protein
VRLRQAVCLALLLGCSASAWAQTAGGADDLDDPKLARRLKNRVALPLSALAPDSVSATVSPVAPADVLAVTPSLPPPGSPALAPDSAAPDSAAPVAPVDTISARPSRAGEGEGKGRTPLLELGYRRFSFVRIGATDPSSTIGASASEPFNSLSLDFYPISRLVRFGMSTQYAWQSGTFNSGSGDYLIAQSFSLGLQHPGQQITPYVQALAGAGYMRRFQFDRTVPTAYWQFGVDIGLDFFLASHALVSAGIGYLRPVNGFAVEQAFTTVYVDTWSFKLGIGI